MDFNEVSRSNFEVRLRSRAWTRFEAQTCNLLKFQFFTHSKRASCLLLPPVLPTRLVPSSIIHDRVVARSRNFNLDHVRVSNHFTQPLLSGWEISDKLSGPCHLVSLNRPVVRSFVPRLARGALFPAEMRPRARGANPIQNSTECILIQLN